MYWFRNVRYLKGKNMKPSFIFFLITGLLSTHLTAQDESAVCSYLFNASFDITKTATETISLAVDAVWYASELNGNIETKNGTLTQNQYNQNQWTYSSSPNDKLVLVFVNGAIVYFTFYTFDGDKNGDADDFKNSHLIDFNTSIQNYMNMRINSSTIWPQYGLISWERTISGSLVTGGELTTLNIDHNGKIDYDIGYSFALYTYTEQVSGTSSTASLNVNISETYRRKMIHNSDARQFVMNTEITNNSTGTIGGNTYKYQNGYVFWAAGTQFADSANAGIYNQAIDAGYWEAQGTMLKNGQQYGTLMFDGPVINYTSGPNLILHLNNGTNIPLHTLIGSPITGIDDTPVINDYSLMQNFPNPFNSSTVIRWNMKKDTRVSIILYDVLGSEVKKILDEERPAGINEIRFESKDVTSGIYFYKLITGDFTAVKKMVITK
jgi:hypothetical protein